MPFDEEEQRLFRRIQDFFHLPKAWGERALEWNEIVQELSRLNRLHRTYRRRYAKRRR